MHAGLIALVGWLLLVLVSPASAAQSPGLSASAAGDVYEHVIVPGDTLIGLGQALLARPSDWRAVSRLNRVRNPRRLRPGSTLKIPIELMRHLPGSADVEWVRGAVRVHAPTGGSVAALTGASVTPGHTVETAAESSVGLRLSTGAGVSVGELARVTFIEMRAFPDAESSRTVLGVERGRMQNRVTPSAAPGQHYEIRTPVVSIAVRGTNFRIGVDEGATRALTEVDDGVVGVSADASLVEVEAGFGSLTLAGELPGSPRPLLPPPSLDAGGLDVSRLPPSLRWPALGGATTYRVVLWSEGRTAQLDDRIVATPDVSFPSLADGTYEVVVRGIEADGLEGSDAALVFALAARPQPPIVQAPVAGTVLFGDRVTLQWTRPAGVPRFDVQVGRDGAFDPPAWVHEGHADVTMAVPLEAGEYVWRVASRDGTRGPWSENMPFTLRAIPPEGPPAGLSDTGKGDLTLRWAGAAPGDSYAVQIARDATFSELLVDRRVDEPTLTLERPLPGTYYVRVRVLNAEGTPGPFGEPQSFAVPKVPRSRWWWLLAPAAAIGAVLAAR